MSDDTPCLHRGVARALERLAGDMLIADSGPHVAFIVGVDQTGEPDLWIAGSDGKSHNIARISVARVNESARPAPWTWDDLAAASTFLSDLVSGLQPYNHRGFDDPVRGAVDYARRQRDHRRERALQKMIEKQQKFKCTCGLYFRTERGMKQHRARAWIHKGEPGGLPAGHRAEFP